MIKDTSADTSKKKATPPPDFLSKQDAEVSSAWKEDLAEWMFHYGPFVLVATLLAGGGFFLVRQLLPNLKQPAVIQSTETTENASIGGDKVGVNTTNSLNSVSSLRDLYRAVITAHGGRNQLENVVSVHLVGEMEANGKRMDFQLIRKRPSMALIKLKLDSSIVTDAVSGDVAWRRIDLVGKEDEYVRLSESEKQRILGTSGSLFDPFLTHALNSIDNTSTYLESSYKGVPVYTVNFELAGKAYQAEVDMQSFLTLAIRDTITVDGLKAELVMDFSDYRDVEGIMIPFKTEISVDGERLQTVQVRVADTDMGVFSSLFELPEELRIEAGEPVNR